MGCVFNLFSEAHYGFVPVGIQEPARDDSVRSSNKIADVALDAFSGLPKLTRLDLRNNPLTNVKATDLLPVAENPARPRYPGVEDLFRRATLEEAHIKLYCAATRHPIFASD